MLLLLLRYLLSSANGMRSKQRALKLWNHPQTAKLVLKTSEAKRYNASRNTVSFPAEIVVHSVRKPLLSPFLLLQSREKRCDDIRPLGSDGFTAVFEFFSVSTVRVFWFLRSRESRVSECGRAIGVSARSATAAAAGERARGGEIASGFRSRSSTCVQRRASLLKVATLQRSVISVDVNETLDVIRILLNVWGVSFFASFLIIRDHVPLPFYMFCVMTSEWKLFIWYQKDNSCKNACSFL